jgi:hypothetical protein
MMKKLLAAIAVLVAIVAVAVYFFLFNLNGIIKSALEKYGSEVTQTAVNISSVDLSLATGHGAVNGFSLGNPKAFVAAKAMKIGSVDFQVDTKTVTGSQPIVIDVININSPDITFEVGNDGISNLQVLGKNVQGAPSSGASDKSDSGTSARKVIIKNLYIRNGKVAITHALLRRREVSANLPTIHLTNIGQGGVGVTPEEVTKRILTEISKQASTVGFATLTKEIPSLGKLGSDVTGKANNALKDVTKGFLAR